MKNRNKLTPYHFENLLKARAAVIEMAAFVVG